jgi:hypothetical protein
MPASEECIDPSEQISFNYQHEQSISDKNLLPFDRFSLNKLDDYLQNFNKNTVKADPTNQSERSLPILYWSESDALDMAHFHRQPESLSFAYNSSALVKNTSSFYKVVPDKNYFMILDLETSDLYIHNIKLNAPEEEGLKDKKFYLNPVQTEIQKIATNIVDMDSNEDSHIFLSKEGQVGYYMANQINQPEAKFTDVVEGQKIAKVACGSFTHFVVTSNNQLYFTDLRSNIANKVVNFLQGQSFYPETQLNDYISKNKLSVDLIL